MKRINSLTTEQQSKFKEWTKNWVEVGLSTEPANFDAATEAALKAYQLCNLKKPMVVLRMASPYAATVGGALAWQMLKTMKPDHVTDQVGSQVSAQVGAQVRDQVSAQVGAQVRDQVWAQVRAQVSAQVGAQVSAQVGSQVSDQVRAQVSDQVRSKVSDQVRDQVRDQVSDQVWAQVWAQVRSKVWAQVSDQVWAQVSAQVWAQVSAQVWAQVSDQVMDEGFQTAKDGIYNDGASNIGWAGFSAWVSYFRDVCGWENEALKKFEITETLVKNCGWTWWHQNVLAISDRPQSIRRDEEGRLHCEDGPSMLYRDGWALYHWHGVAIPKEWVTWAKPSAKEALQWPNVEQRRAACEIVGWASILRELNARVIDIDPDPEIGTLVEVDLPDAGNERFIRVRCGTGREFALAVPPSMKTALQASAWTYGLDEDMENYKPEVRT